MSGWRPARCLPVLIRQIDQHAPHRSKASDGTIGDARHQAGQSDHNPDRNGVVHAVDITQDPRHGADMDKLAHQLVASRDRRIKYIIWDRRIVSATISPWRWRPYSGSDPHRQHLHLSVVPGPAADSEQNWRIYMGGAAEIDPRAIKLSDGTSLDAALRTLMARTDALCNHERFLARTTSARVLAELAAIRGTLAAWTDTHGAPLTGAELLTAIRQSTETVLHSVLDPATVQQILADVPDQGEGTAGGDPPAGG